MGASEGYLKVGSIEQLKQRSCAIVTGGGHTIAVFFHNDRAYAVDNRCPHMGFPLDRGSLKDEILTCHWHHARFDLLTGGTFDPFADDVRTFPVHVIDDEIWVNPSPPPRDELKHWSARLRDGLEHNIRLVIAKSVLGLHATGADYQFALKIGARFGTTYSASGWSPAMTILTSTANMLPYLSPEDRPLALYQGLMHVAVDCMGKPPHFPMEPLPTGETRPDVFQRWFRNFIEVRDAEGAERCLSTAIELGLPAEALGNMIFSAATDHIYLDGGHIVDYANKAFELLDHIGWEHAHKILPSLVHPMAMAKRSQELNSWRHPVDIAELVWKAREDLPTVYQQGLDQRGEWRDEERLAKVILDNNPAATLDAIKEAIREGASPEQLGGAVAYAAFLRMAQFHTSNEFGDWDTVHNTLTAANALHQALKRFPSMELVRGVFDTAMSIYLDRFLNVPPQRIPEGPEEVADSASLLAEIQTGMDVQQQVEEVAQLVARYLGSGGDPRCLLANLGHVMLREDSDFHSFQIVDASFNQYMSRCGTDAGRHVLVAMSRFLAAHSPTPRAVGQTYNIALRLHRGHEIFSNASESSAQA